MGPALGRGRTGLGFPIVVLGGPHGDLPLSEGMGRPVAGLVAGGNLSAVVEMGEMRKAAWARSMVANIRSAARLAANAATKSSGGSAVLWGA